MNQRDRYIAGVRWKDIQKMWWMILTGLVVAIIDGFLTIMAARSHSNPYSLYIGLGWGILLALGTTAYSIWHYYRFRKKF